MESAGKRFRQLLRDEPYLFTGGIYSPLDAQIAERAGMKSIYLSGTEERLQGSTGFTNSREH
jgi:2-methylisocitrate lyase-like PEP mutase family enzyme